LQQKFRRIFLINVEMSFGAVGIVGGSAACDGSVAIAVVSILRRFLQKSSDRKTQKLRQPLVRVLNSALSP
jgi:hypothetical protein